MYFYSIILISIKNYTAYYLRTSSWIIYCIQNNVLNASTIVNWFCHKTYMHMYIMWDIINHQIQEKEVLSKTLKDVRPNPYILQSKPYIILDKTDEFVVIYLYDSYIYIGHPIVIFYFKKAYYRCSFTFWLHNCFIKNYFKQYYYMN